MLSISSVCDFAGTLSTVTIHSNQLFRDAIDPSGCLQLLEEIPASSPYAKRYNYPLQAIPSYMLPPDRQPQHTNETAKRLEFELKTILQSLARSLFGPAGITNKVGYAFGLGLERWAMQLYHIPDIRLFWTQDSGFLHQFETDDIHREIIYKPVSVYPQCILDLSFWLRDSPESTVPEQSDNQNELDPISLAVERDFYDLVRSVAGDLIEQVRLIDRFIDPKTGRRSHCYRLIYRDQHRTLTMDEVRPIHQQIAQCATDRFGVQIR
ncbi:unnamed protein product [Echinostoma caproni]|uniref:phenylalanine--tRNA ligase n=1 Tax=Echinostoma caproni TaxID=27848 RepID=A0A183AB65_9TREM|nr:unnamed protein product [Echinostoma caproni]